MSKSDQNYGRLIIAILAVSICLSLGGQAQTCSEAKAGMQYESGNASLSKVGIADCNCPPHYYTVLHRGQTTWEYTSSSDAYHAPPEVSAYMDIEMNTTVSFGTVTWDKWLAEDGVTLRDGCDGLGGVFTTSSGCSGTASFYRDSNYGPGWPNMDCSTSFGNEICVGPPPSGDCFSEAWYIVSVLQGGLWYDTSDGCGFEKSSWNYNVDNPNTQVSPNYSASTVSITHTGSGHENEFTTAELKNMVATRAAARISNVFAAGDPQSARMLVRDESCAIETDSKYRIVITGTIPKKRYIITYLVVTKHGNGKSTSVVRTIRVTAPDARLWYYPSSDGAMLPKPSWPSVNCTADLQESITYTAVQIQLDGGSNSSY